ncbi:L-glutamyl-[BtrI acyl-carrier protein] decarboxylase [compost metagenome]
MVRSERPAELENQPVTLVGQLCTPKDVLARQQPVAALAVGDLLVFTLAGAYAWNISHQNFLMHEPPQVVFLEA